MAINHKLADARNISKKDRKKIEKLHTKLQALMDTDLLDIESIPEYNNRVAHYEYKLQKLWGFEQTPRYHTWWFNDPKCSCPKSDNKDMLGSSYRSRSTQCPLHRNI